MTTTSPFRSRPLVLALLAAAAFLPGVPAARAAMLFTVAQSGSNVVVSGSGTFNIAGLTKGGNDIGHGGVDSFSATLGVGLSTAGYNYSSISGPTNFGSTSDNFLSANTNTGTGFGVDGLDHILFLPQTYVSGATLSGTSTFNNQTLAGLGITTGTYTYTWGTGANADSLTIYAGVPVPEPSTWALLALGTAALGLALRQHRHTAAARA